MIMVDKETRDYRAREIVKTVGIDPGAEGEGGSRAVKLRGTHGETKWLPVTETEASAIGKVLVPDDSAHGVHIELEPYESLDLTEPMFEACGLECPAMIGGKCRRDKNEFCTLYKFASAAAEVVYGWALDSNQDEEAGNSVDGPGWYALFRNSDQQPGDVMRAGVILWELPSFSVQVERFDSEEELSRDWAKILADTEECDDEDDYDYDSDEDDSDVEYDPEDGQPVGGKG